MEQTDFAFDVPPRTPLPDRPIVIMRWDPESGRVTTEWPELQIMRASFRDWRVALDVVLHVTNDHVRVVVRV